ncbi:unnamed protein product [Spirodela intermedia]|uniref:Ig-like domain-containing protein n=1 Tax=Spirodela intermedia TaxID=51605 RepID=A0ABN7E8R9_SPIIN|nr:unnamed protein product [Spirodela intermedia]
MGRQIIFDGYHLTSGKMATLRLSGGCHPTKRSWMEPLEPLLALLPNYTSDPLASLAGRRYFSLTCTTTPCLRPSWPLVMWKGSGAHMPPLVLAT